jgi:pyruvate dehydrogenase E2 component (dihydrolipoamide acetyltransferase)
MAQNANNVSEYKLPDVGEGLTEAELVTWKVKVGDTIKVNDIICEIETAKSLVELPSPYAGAVARLMVSEGETVAVGTPIIAISSDTAGARSAGRVSAERPSAAVETETTIVAPPEEGAIEPGMVGSPAPNADKPMPTLVGYGPKAGESKRRPRRGTGRHGDEAGASARRPSAPTAPPPAPVQPAPSAAPPRQRDDVADSRAAKVLAKPPVRKLARDLGVDLGAVTPTGPGGTISRSDVESFASGSSSAARAGEPIGQAHGEYADQSSPSPSPALEVSEVAAGGRETRVPVKGVRKMTAQAMVASAFTAPHVTEWMTVDVTKTMKMVQRLRNDRAFADVKVTPLLLVARAVCLAVRRTPEVNSTWDESAQEIVLKHYVHLGIAAATPRGLVVPNVKNADSLSALDLARALGELTSTARSGKTQPADMAGGTFTITNVGMFGVDGGTPILNPGETAILCMGAIRRQPWIVGNKIRPRWLMTLAMSFDHRIVDGEQGSRFLSDVATILSSPGKALLF